MSNHLAADPAARNRDVLRECGRPSRFTETEWRCTSCSKLSVCSHWQALHASLLRSAFTLAFQRGFDLIRAGDPALQSIRDPAGLLEELRRGAEPARSNAILAALVRAAQSGDRSKDGAVTLLLLSLWPGLDAIQRRLSRQFAGRRDELASELTARLVEGVRGLRLDRVQRIASTLIRNVERDIHRSLRARQSESCLTQPLADNDDRGDDDPVSALGLPLNLDTDAAVHLLGRRIRPVIGGDADLVIAVSVAGLRHREAAEALGLGHDAVRKRYQRALNRLRDDLQSAA